MPTQNELKQKERQANASLGSLLICANCGWQMAAYGCAAKASARITIRPMLGATKIQGYEKLSPSEMSEALASAGTSYQVRCTAKLTSDKMPTMHPNPSDP